MIVLLIIALVINIGVVWSIFSIKAHIEKQTAIQTAQTLLIAKMAKQIGVESDEVNNLLGTLSKQL